MGEIPVPFDSPDFLDDLPRYPLLVQLLRVTAATVPGPTGGTSSGVGTGNVPPAILYVSSTQQLRTDTLSPRDREPCLVVDVNGYGLNAGYYLGRLSGSYQSLPVYEVTVLAGGSSFPQGTGALPGLTAAQQAMLNASLTPTQLTDLNNLTACQLQVLLQLPVVNIQQLANLTPTQLQNIVGPLSFTPLAQLAQQLPTSQVLLLSSAYPQLYQAVNQFLTPVQALQLLGNLSSQQLSTLVSLTPAQLQVVGQLTLPQLQTLTGLTPAQVPVIVGQLPLAQLGPLLALPTPQLQQLANNLPSAQQVQQLLQAMPIPAIGNLSAQQLSALGTTPAPLLGNQPQFPFLPLIVGQPSSIPSLFQGYAPVVVDTTGKVWVNLGGVWTNPANVGTVSSVTVNSANGVSAIGSGSGLVSLTFSLGDITPTSVIASGSAPSAVTRTDASNNSVIQAFTIGHDSSLTTIAGFGSSTYYQLKSGSTPGTLVAQVDTILAALSKGRQIYYAVDSTTKREAWRFETDGSVAKQAWFGSASVVQQSGDIATALANYGLVTGGTVVAPAGTLTGTTLAGGVTASSLTSLGVQAQALNMGTHLIDNVVDPVAAQDAATKNYVDMAVAALEAKNECLAATTAALAAATYNNGSSGVGATLTLTVAAVLVLDGYTPALNDRLLIKNQADAKQNGIYFLSTVGVLGVTQAVLTRSLDFDQPGDGINGALVFVLNGTANGNTLWTCSTSGTITFGTTLINWSKFTGTTYTGDETTIHLAGTTFSCLSAPILSNARTINGVSFDGSGNITVTAAAGTLTGTTLNSTVVTSSLTSVGTLGSLTVQITGGTNNIISTAVIVGSGTVASGSPAAGFGIQTQYRLDSATVANRAVCNDSLSWSVATDASRNPRRTISLIDASTTTEILRMETGGVGFFGHAVQTASSSPDLGTLIVGYGLASGTPTFSAANITSSLAGGTTFPVDYILIQDQKTQNTAGGTATSGSWQTRTLNTKVTDVNSNVSSLSSNQITLVAGTYICRISVPGFGVDRFQARLQNVTDTATVLTGTSEFSAAVASPFTTRSVIMGRFTIAASKHLEVQMQNQTTLATNGFGVPSNFTGEVYTSAEFQRVA